MDTATLAIVGLGSLLFFGVLIWKGIWFLRKISAAPDGEDPGDD
jgi:hypothetical protein